MNILIAAGGTGGHLFPGIAVAQEFIRRDRGNTVAFMGSTGGVEARILPKLSFRLLTVRVKGFAGKNIFAKLASLCCLPAALWKAGTYIRRFQADIVIGFGGYISFPAVVAAAALGIPTAVHEQNSIPGLSNRLLNRIAGRTFISYEGSMRFFRTGSTEFSGMPVRLPGPAKPAQGRSGPFCIFVCGGSQGSGEINRAVAESLPLLQDRQKNMRFIHQSGKSDYSTMAAAYKKYGFEALVAPFIDDMFGCYRQAHLVVSRAGAATLAELAACARAAILIPYPFAAGNHQTVNAQTFVEGGAALTLPSKDLSGRALASMIERLVGDREKLQQMEKRAGALARPDAAATIVAACYRLAARQPAG